jgi:cob(I)alamin adenosyltransferase
MNLPARILIFTGDGKGKTTAALGMALRAAGHRMRTCIIQFVKSAKSGEHQAVRELAGVEIIRTGIGYVPPESDPAFALHRKAAEEGLRKAAEAIASGGFDLVVLDEVCFAVDKGLLEESRVIETLRRAAPSQVIVLTGRGATQGLIDLADTVTEMHGVKHGLATGRRQQKGVEL